MAASTSELPHGSSDCTHAAEGLTFVELFIKFALEELIVELASLALGPGEMLCQINRQLYDAKSRNILSGGARGRPALTVAASTSELPHSSSDCAHAAEGLTFIELFIKFTLEELIVELASLALGPEEMLY